MLLTMEILCTKTNGFSSIIVGMLHKDRFLFQYPKRLGDRECNSLKEKTKTSNNKKVESIDSNMKANNFFHEVAVWITQVSIKSGNVLSLGTRSILQIAIPNKFKTLY